MVLPDELELEFRNKLMDFDQEQHMPLITPFELAVRKEAHQKGREEGRIEATLNLVTRQARKKFSDLTSVDEAAIRNLPLEELELLTEALLDITDVDDLRRWIKTRQQQP
jgi:hypothetical protein